MNLYLEVIKMKAMTIIRLRGLLEKEIVDAEKYVSYLLDKTNNSILPEDRVKYSEMLYDYEDYLKELEKLRDQVAGSEVDDE
jgi:hypothetical protein